MKRLAETAVLLRTRYEFDVGLYQPAPPELQYAKLLGCSVSPF